MENTSKRFTLNSIDWAKIGKGALIAIAGAVLTYITNTIGGLDFGPATPGIMAFWSVVVNAAQKWLSNYSKNTSI